MQRIRIRVRGGSMASALRDGDEVDVRIASGREAGIGDVVLVLAERTTVLHRVIARDARGVRTQGDASRAPDPLVPFERVLGIAEVPSRPIFAALRGWRRLFADLLRGRVGPRAPDANAAASPQETAASGDPGRAQGSMR